MTLAWRIMPIVGLSALVLVMAPGLLAAVALGRSRTVDQWLLDGFILSLVGVSVFSGVAQALVGGMLRGRAYAAYLLVLTALPGAWAMRRAGSAPDVRRASMRPWAVRGPITLELSFKHYRAAEILAYLPIVTRVNSHTIRFVGKDILDVSRFIEFVQTYQPGLSP